MRTILTLLIFFTCINSYSQITVTGSNLVNIGDIIHQSIDDNTQINIGQTGQGQYWNFSQLISMNSETFLILDPVNTPYYNDYPNSDICINTDSDFIYATKSPNAIHLLGSNDSVLQSPLLVVPFPLFFGANYTEGPNIVLDSLISGPMLNILLPMIFDTSIDTIAYFLTNGQAHIPDTLNILAQVTQNFLVDADGSITIPMGTYDCVRVRQEMINSNTVSIYFTDTLTGANSGWYSLGAPTTDVEVAYNWFSNNPSTKFSLLEVSLDSLGNQQGEVTFLDAAPSSTSNILPSDMFEIYPIPASTNISINTNIDNLVNLFLFDVTGKELESFEFQNRTDINLSKYDKGIYLFHIRTEEGVLIKKVILE